MPKTPLEGYGYSPELCAKLCVELYDTREWQLLRDVPVLTMIYLLQDGFFKKVQFTSVPNCWQVRLTKRGREQIA